MVLLLVLLWLLAGLVLRPILQVGHLVWEMRGHLGLAKTCNKPSYLHMVLNLLPSPVLCHGRDVHPTWASVDNVTVTLRVWDSKSTKSDEDLE